jgi:uncharacterized membrane protein YbaN (DUF454 family)
MTITEQQRKTTMAPYDSHEVLTRSRRQDSDSHWSVKLLALVILLLCAAIGMVGIILPVIPGFLFLGIAALITARMFPALARRLRRHRIFATWLDSSVGFARLSLRDKVRYSAWLVLRMLLDGAILLHRALTRLIVFIGRKPGA